MHWAMTGQVAQMALARPDASRSFSGKKMLWSSPRHRASSRHSIDPDYDFWVPQAGGPATLSRRTNGPTAHAQPVKRSTKKLKSAAQSQVYQVTPKSWPGEEPVVIAVAMMAKTMRTMAPMMKILMPP